MTPTIIIAATALAMMGIWISTIGICAFMLGAKDHDVEENKEESR